jgi:7,8-dihydroneopterin aldolase/epimerase/oxygenase
MTSDCLHVNGIRAYGYTGFLPEEQALGQWYEVNLSLWLDLHPSSQSDDLNDTYDYGAPVLAIQQLIRTERFALVERLADAIANLVLASNKVQQVRVRLTKLAPPIPDFGGSITVDITRPISNKVISS